ncbi:MAG: peptide deformylase [Metamycoplasmataceae bacterium]
MIYKINIVQLPEKVLRQKSVDVLLPLNEEDELLAKKMIYHVTDSIKKGSKFRPAVGVAAVQYGILKNMFFVHILNPDNSILFSDVLINPKVLGLSDINTALSSGEGCLSVGRKILNQDGYVKRSGHIKLEAFSYYKNKKIVIDAYGYLAIVIQHELDHLDGKLFIDRIDKKNKWAGEKDLNLL